MTTIKKLFLPEFMLPQDKRLGRLPTARQAYSKVTGLVWPALVENLLGWLIGVVDTLMVAGIGYHAIAAVGLVTQPIYLTQTLIFALTSSVSIICSHRKGANDREKAIDTLKQGIIICFIISVVMSVVFIPFSRQVVVFMGAKADTVVMATSYFSVMLYGIPMYNFILLISAAQRGVGNSRISMTINVTASILDVVFSYLLINGSWGFPKLGVTGGAVANIIGWSISLIMGIYSLVTPEAYLYLAFNKKWRLSAETLKAMWKIGVGNLAEGLCVRVGFIASSKIVAELGTVSLAANEILSRILNLSFSITTAFGSTAATLAGNSNGQKRFDLTALYCKICQRISSSSACIIFIIFNIFGTSIINLFTNSTEVISIAKPLLIILSIVVAFQSYQLVYGGGLSGSGDTKFLAFMYMVCIMIIRPISSYFLAYTLGFGLTGVWVAILIDQVSRLVLTQRRFKSDIWRKIVI